MADSIYLWDNFSRGISGFSITSKKIEGDVIPANAIRDRVGNPIRDRAGNIIESRV